MPLTNWKYKSYHVLSEILLPWKSQGVSRNYRGDKVVKTVIDNVSKTYLRVEVESEIEEFRCHEAESKKSYCSAVKIIALIGVKTK